MARSNYKQARSNYKQAGLNCKQAGLNCKQAGSEPRFESHAHAPDSMIIITAEPGLTS